MMQFVLIIFSQIAFVCFRTINVKHIAENRLVATLISGTLMSALWFYTTAVGVNAINDGSVINFITILIGGIIGVVLAMRHKYILRKLHYGWVWIFSEYSFRGDSHFYSYGNTGKLFSSLYFTKKESKGYFLAYYFSAI